jgi:hypothetical protein
MRLSEVVGKDDLLQVFLWRGYSPVTSSTKDKNYGDDSQCDLNLAG